MVHFFYLRVMFMNMYFHSFPVNVVSVTFSCVIMNFPLSLVSLFPLKVAFGETFEEKEVAAI